MTTASGLPFGKPALKRLCTIRFSWQSVFYAAKTIETKANNLNIIQFVEIENQQAQMRKNNFGIRTYLRIFGEKIIFPGKSRI
ncbi:MAG: hypothetical protein LBT05_02535 [Planctomycetaceae bacterium]|nr:hypothetical protein [Planctomycetaceae bacterium]